MSGLLRRLTRRSPATADENRSPAIESSDPAAAPAETPAEPGGHSPASVWAGQAPAADPSVQPAAGDEAAGQSPATAGDEAAGQSATTADPGAASQSATTADPGAAAQSSPPGEQPTVVLPATGEQPLPAWTVAATQPTAYAAQPAPPRDLPAGVDPGDLAAAPAASARRGKLRRRLRYLRHVRELLLRDLGGFTYEVHRTAGGTAQESHRRLATAKAERLSKLDEEVLALESRLGEPHAEVILREPGIGGTCPECGELHASDAHFCSRCGAPLDDKARAQRAAEAPPATESQTTAEPQPASVLWAGGPRPAPEEPEPPQPPSEVTSQWLATDRPTTFSRAEQPEESKADEPAGPDEIAKSDEPATALDEPATAVETPAADEPEPEKPAATADEPKADEAVAKPKPKRVSKPRKRAPAKRKAQPDPDFEANGRSSDENVTPPHGDPVASPREPGS